MKTSSDEKPVPPTRQLNAQEYQRYIAAGNTPFEQVKPILDSRCVTCHACYDAPCQLQMGSGAGIERGASKVLVYDATRFHPAAPTRLFIDASTTAQWRTKGFYPVLNETKIPATQQANLDAAVLNRMLQLKKRNPTPGPGPLPDSFDDVSAAPLLCAGLIGYRSLKKAGDARRLGIYGFGAAAHIIAQVARFQKRDVFAFTRPGDSTAQAFATRLGAVWAGGSDELPPVKLEAAIIFAPAGPLVPAALRALEKGGTLVCGGIHMSDIPAFPYRDLWEERTICSVANLTRRDAEEFFALAPLVPVRTETQTFPLDQANIALARLRSGQLSGAAVLVTS
jgi:hypothetical protein